MSELKCSHFKKEMLLLFFLVLYNIIGGGHFEFCAQAGHVCAEPEVQLKGRFCICDLSDGNGALRNLKYN